MRKTDIRTGQIYAWKQNNWTSPEALVFLSAEVHRTRRRSEPESPRYIKDEAYDKITTSRDFSGVLAGYPVLSLIRPKAGELQLLRDADLETILASGLSQELQAAGAYFTLLTRMAGVVGPYEEIMSRYTAEQERIKREHEKREAELRHLAALRDSLTKRFSALGIRLLQDYRHDDRMGLQMGDLEKVAARLEELQ